MVKLLLLPSMAAAMHVMAPNQFDYQGLKTTLKGFAAKGKAEGGIDSGTAGAIRGFMSTITDDLLTALEADRNHSQTIYNAGVAGVNNCNSERSEWFNPEAGCNSAFDAHNTEVSDDQGTHESCRAQEVVTWNNFSAHCTTMANRVCSWAVCAQPEGGFAGGDTDAVNTYMQCICNFFDDHRGDYYDERSKCQDATNDHHAQTALCDRQQGDFEESYCDRESDVQDKCEWYDGCRFQRESNLLLIKAETEDLEEIFQQQFVALHHLLCYGEQMLQNITDLSGCDDTSKVCESYTGCPEIVYGKADDYIECTEPQLEYPCTAGFEANFYGSYQDSCTPVCHCDPCNKDKVSGKIWNGGQKATPGAQHAIK